MKNPVQPVISLVRKELRSMLNGPSAYVVALFFLVFSSVWFLRIHQFAARDYASFREFFSVLPFFNILMIPLLTMRVWAEEYRSGTGEILFTLPFSGFQLVLGKFLAVLLLYTIIVLLTLPMLLILSALGDFAYGPLFTQYLGSLLLGAASISLGLWISSLTWNQVSAGLITMAFLLMFTLLFQALQELTATPDWMAGLFRYFSLNYRIDSFSKGVLDSRDFGFFVLMTVLFLYANAIVIRLRKWS
ncbi:ABC transporter permease [Salinispira pacifica]|uniref:Gliding motility protein GldF n=1 Tax=Salinispira pacifica TaxID=1307761 RepID=V5WHK6_9SPIO|nr:ABC transporter permease [Salinispira pacifica]AHC15004.1 gliding motility protein GldF [Salinispira pacifica]